MSTGNKKSFHSAYVNFNSISLIDTKTYSLMLKQLAYLGSNPNRFLNHKKKKNNNMPQFELITFFIQTLSVSICFSLFYFVYTKLILSHFNFSAKCREKVTVFSDKTIKKININRLYNKIFFLIK